MPKPPETQFWLGDGMEGQAIPISPVWLQGKMGEMGKIGGLCLCLCLFLCLAFFRRRRCARPAGVITHSAYGLMYSRTACRPGVGPPLVTPLPARAPGRSRGPARHEPRCPGRTPILLAPCTMLHSPVTFAAIYCPLGTPSRPPLQCSSAGMRRADAQQDRRSGLRAFAFAGAIGHHCTCASLDCRPDSYRVLRLLFAP